jgi:uncharacterized Zn-binding protein involved in type VI secretion
MPQITRDNDLAATNHGCDPIVGVIATCRSVFANRIVVARPGDKPKPHKKTCDCPPCCCDHPAEINRGSRTVFTEGIPVARTGDSADLGAMLPGSPNVFAG